MAALTAFLDTSVLLAGIVELGPTEPQRVMDAVSRGKLVRPLTSWHCCLELYSVATRLPEEYRVAPDDALQILEEEVLARFRVVDLPASARAELLRELASGRVTGGRAYDAHIGASARHAGATVLVTENRKHFVSLLRYGVRVLTSAELCSELRL